MLFSWLSVAQYEDLRAINCLSNTEETAGSSFPVLVHLIPLCVTKL